MNFTYADFAKMIDHSLLNPALTTADLEAGCRLALAYDGHARQMPASGIAPVAIAARSSVGGY